MRINLRSGLVLSVILGITLMPGVAQGQLIENLVLFDEAADPWVISTDIQEGLEIYTDRGSEVELLPEAYQGLEWIQTSNDSADWRDGNPDIIATFDVTSDVIVYISFDERVDVPSCFSAWEETGDFLLNSGEGVEYNIRSMAFDSGTTIELCRYEDDAGYYTIMVESTGPPPPAPPPPVSLVPSSTFAIVGQGFGLALNVDSITGAAWTKDDVSINATKALDANPGPTDTEITFSPLAPSDAGVYCVTGTTGEDVAVDECYDLSEILDSGSTIPVGGTVGLVLLSIMMALAGAFMLRRLSLS